MLGFGKSAHIYLYKVNKLVCKTKNLNLKKSRDRSLLQKERKQGAVASFSDLT